MPINSLNNNTENTESSNQVDTLTETAKKLTPEEKTEVSKNINLPKIRKKTINKEQSNQQMAKAESLSPEKVNNIKNVINEYANDEVYGHAIKEYTIVGMADAHEFVAGGPEQQNLENKLIEITQSLSQKGFDRSTILNRQNINIGGGFLDKQTQNLATDQEKSDKLNKWLSIARALELLNSFDQNQITKISPKLKIKTKIADEKGGEYRTASFKTNIDENELPEAAPPPGKILFKFSQISSRITGTQGGEIYNEDDYGSDVFSLGGISNNIQYQNKYDKQKKEDGTSKINRQTKANKPQQKDMQVGNGIGATALKNNIGSQFKINNKGTYLKDVYKDLNNFKDYNIEQKPSYNTSTTAVGPTYSINILANKITPDHRLNEYFDFNKDENGIIRSISMKDSILSGNPAKDFNTSVEILEKISNTENDIQINDFIKNVKQKRSTQEQNDKFFNAIALAE